VVVDTGKGTAATLAAVAQVVAVRGDLSEIMAACILMGKPIPLREKPTTTRRMDMELLEMLQKAAADIAAKHAGVAALLRDLDQDAQTAITRANAQRHTANAMAKVVAIINEILPQDMRVELPPEPPPEIPY
jgi:hypothetical protein